MVHQIIISKLSFLSFGSFSALLNFTLSDHELSHRPPCGIFVNRAGAAVTGVGIGRIFGVPSVAFFGWGIAVIGDKLTWNLGETRALLVE